MGNIWDSKLNKCKFGVDNDVENKFILTIYNEGQNTLEVKYMEYIDIDGDHNGENKMKMKYNSDTVKLDSVELNCKRVGSVMSPLNKYLIFFQEENGLIYYIDIKKDKIVDKIELNDKLQSTDYLYNCIQNTNDLIVKSLNSLYYIKFDKKSLKLSKFKLKEYETSDFIIFLYSNYLFVRDKSPNGNQLNFIDIFSLDAELLKNEEKLRDLVRLNNMTVDELCLSSDGSYLIFKTNNCELFVYLLSNMKKIGQLKLNDTFTNIVNYKNTISFKYGLRPETAKLWSVTIVNDQIL